MTTEMSRSVATTKSNLTPTAFPARIRLEREHALRTIGKTDELDVEPSSLSVTSLASRPARSTASATALIHACS